ncbi:hypothetical protein TraAM80_03894 [Trypanosoma rangeli]|uniref:Uncharacterized protein n=1 Tax=Trypanosoma rangeli TaxID=5698 RepID=A0A3R7MIB6_TRYRA|nr:uncharacterized protein TraAM80_03894 [Trypanosoma rangeli]RNF06427.1 hypothetical protein TraAM80_03894 [Trypanosoma rangeli]|eukprot:RNF06427.1 hypothetical protein TraAM80_03894 [Trypanosoma rangeli]
MKANITTRHGFRMSLHVGSVTGKALTGAVTRVMGKFLANQKHWASCTLFVHRTRSHFVLKSPSVHVIPEGHILALPLLNTKMERMQEGFNNSQCSPIAREAHTISCTVPLTIPYSTALRCTGGGLDKTEVEICFAVPTEEMVNAGVVAANGC